ncbi:unnamed protein product [Rhodiola kirilowii]
MIDRLTKLKSQGCQMKESGEEEEDRLSELPIHLKEAILGCLTISDAGKTSVLSSKWRYVWTGLRKLLVYPSFWQGSTELTSKALTQILLTHNGPIGEFYLYLPFIDNLDAFWLLRLSEKGVENVTINSYNRMRGLLSVPSSMFECLELKRLSLFNCTLSPPLEFRGFPNLVSLDLNCVCIEAQFLKNLIDKCPLLENLTLSGPSSGIEMPIALNSHSLKTLYLENIYLGSVSFENVSNLTNVSLCGKIGYDQRDLQRRLRAWEFMSYLFGIKELSFEFYFEETSASDLIPKKLPKLLGNLKTVDFYYMDASSVDQMAFMLCIFRSSPNLQNLNIHSNKHAYGRLFDKDSLRAAIAYLKVEA